LDFKTDAFYLGRREKIDKRLEEISTFGVSQKIIDAYYAYYGVVCVGVNWQAFSLDDLLEFSRVPFEVRLQSNFDRFLVLFAYPSYSRFWLKTIKIIVAACQILFCGELYLNLIICWLRLRAQTIDYQMPRNIGI